MEPRSLVVDYRPAGPAMVGCAPQSLAAHFDYMNSLFHALSHYSVHRFQALNAVLSMLHCWEDGVKSLGSGKQIKVEVLACLGLKWLASR